MFDNTVIILILSALAVVLVIVNCVLFIYAAKANRKIDKFLEKGKIKEFKDIFLTQKERHELLKEKLKEAFLRIENLEEISEITIRKVGTVRFNPFNDIGGNQSFVIAMLDNKNTGFIISSIFINESSRIYAKTIKQGKSDYALSKEEVEALDQAINSGIK